MQKESDVEFWADYSDTETSSDAELGDAVSDLQLENCGWWWSQLMLKLWLVI